MRKKLLFWEHPISKFDQKIEREGIQKALKDLISIFKIKIETINQEKAIKVLDKSGVIVASNHPTETDVPVLMSVLSNRPDQSVVAMSSLLNLGKNIDKHIIPVHINHRLMDQNKINLKLRFLRLLSQHQEISATEAHNKNIESINQAAKKVRNGELVSIFPGAGSKEERWFNGIGYLINKIGNTNNNWLVLTYIQGTSGWDYLRIIPLFKLLFPKVKIHFHKPISLKNYQGMEAKDITKKLEKIYQKWTLKIESNQKRVNYNPYLLFRSLILWIGLIR